MFYATYSKDNGYGFIQKANNKKMVITKKREKRLQFATEKEAIDYFNQTAWYNLVYFHHEYTVEDIQNMSIEEAISILDNDGKDIESADVGYAILDKVEGINCKETGEPYVRWW